jgi:mRNA interferase HigB
MGPWLISRNTDRSGVDKMSSIGYSVRMDIRGKLVIEKFTAKHQDAEKPLSRWIAVTENARWGNFSQVRDTFRSADLFRKDGVVYVIFNIGGNKYRLVTEIAYDEVLVVVDVVMTHAEYSKDKWKGRL